MLDIFLGKVTTIQFPSFQFCHVKRGRKRIECNGFTDPHPKISTWNPQARDDGCAIY